MDYGYQTRTIDVDFLILGERFEIELPQGYKCPRIQVDKGNTRLIVLAPLTRGVGTVAAHFVWLSPTSKHTVNLAQGEEIFYVGTGAGVASLFGHTGDSDLFEIRGS